MNRRDALKVLALATTTPTFGAVMSKRQPLGLVIHSFWIRRERPLPPNYGSVSEPLDFVSAAAKLGAAGVQTKIGTLDATLLAKLRDIVERQEMYLEGIITLPKDAGDVARFDAEIAAATQAGATILRTTCLSGRRYETFASAEQFRQFADQSWTSLTLAEPIAAKHGIQLAVENHKDWRIGEMLGWLKRLSSQHVGVCLDTGNSLALLEEPHAVVEAYAPWTFTTHFKDMAMAESADGFLLAEVPLGAGCLDLPRLVTTLRKAKPDVRLNLEMMTRDPLRVPCLTAKYWATLGDVAASELADQLVRVRRHQPTQPLSQISPLSHADQLRVEADNIAQCLKYALEKLA